MMLSYNKESGLLVVEGRTLPLQARSVPVLKEQTEDLQELLVLYTETLILLQGD